MTEGATGGNKAFCTTFGLVRGINTSNLTEGGMVWLSKDTAGAMTAVRPTAPNNGVEIGFCVTKHATNGVIFVTVQNGYELDELHNVYVPSPTNGQVLTYDATDSRWEASTVADQSATNEIQTIDTFSLSGQTLRASLSSDNQPAKTVTLPVVNVTAGTGISVSSATGNYTVTNSAPDQTVSLTNGGGIGVTGTYPSFTLTATDQSASNEGTLGVGAGSSTSSVITSNTSGASGVTINAIGGISISETTSSNGGSINISATDQSVSNEGILGVAINPGADAWLRSNTSTANDIGLVATNNMTITSSNNSNGGQIVFDSKAQIDTFSVSGSTLSLSLKNDGEPAKTVTLPGGGGGGISSLNSLTASTQTFATGTTGTDFNISSATSTHTFNLPTASATNRGLLSSANWTTFNSKIGGTNILWDDSNRRLGVGAATTNATITVQPINTIIPSIYFQNTATTMPDYTNVGFNPNVTINTVGAVSGASLLGGGLAFNGFSAAAGTTSPIRFIGHTGLSPTYPAIVFEAWKTNGSTGRTALTGDEILCSFSAGYTATAQFRASGKINIGSSFTPTAQFEVRGSSVNSNDYSLIVTNSGGSTTTPAICAQNNQKVGIGTNSVDSGATLEVDGTTGGILFPRLTTTQRDALTPTNGLVIYNSTTDKLQVRAGGAWVDLH